MNKQDVEYRDIEGFPGYRIGSDGSAWSCLRMGGNATNRCGQRVGDKWRPLKPSMAGHGYLAVWLRKDGAYFPRYIHRLVLESFVGPCPAGLECRHLNGIKTDCRLSNLSWGTKEENTQDKFLHGTTNRGEKNGNSRLAEGTVIRMRELYASGQYSQARLAQLFGVRQQTVSKITNRKAWKHVES